MGNVNTSESNKVTSNASKPLIWVNFGRFKKKSLILLNMLLPEDKKYTNAIRNLKLRQILTKVILYKLIEEKNLVGHTNYIFCLIKMSEEKLISGSLDKTIKVWNVSTGDCIQTLEGHQEGVLCLLRLNYKQIMSGSYDRTIKIWNSINGNCLQTLEGHGSPVTCLTKLNSNQIASGSENCEIRIWDYSIGKCPFKLKSEEGKASSINCLTKVSDKYFASGSNLIIIWDFKGNEIKSFSSDSLDNTKCIILIQENKLAAATKTCIKIWKILEAKCILTLNGHIHTIFSLLKMNEHEMLSGSLDKSIKLWNFTTGQCLFTLDNKINSVKCLVKLNLKQIAVDNKDKSIKIIDLFFEIV